MMNNTSKPRDHSVISLHALSASSSKGRLVLAGNSWPCVIGKTGCKTQKREGDLSTPFGQWRIRTVLYRPDRIFRPQTALPLKALQERDGWCDAPDDRNYNRPVIQPYPASHESLWRVDHVYDICIVLDYNIVPRKRGFGSAIFFHLTRPDHRPTEGCVAVDYPDMLQILKQLKPISYIKI